VIFNNVTRVTICPFFPSVRYTPDSRNSPSVVLFNYSTLIKETSRPVAVCFAAAGQNLE